jgi:catechol 2,3-dioxygenase-like lactoylglutathione lyase family enzyme
VDVLPVIGVGAIVLFSDDPVKTADFYRAIGLELAAEDHGDGPVHFAAELEGCHFAVYGSESAGRAPGPRVGGCTFVGLTVESVVAALQVARDFGAVVIQDPEPYLWGLRAVVFDPDGRPLELYEPIRR